MSDAREELERERREEWRIEALEERAERQSPCPECGKGVDPWRMETGPNGPCCRACLSAYLPD